MYLAELHGKLSSRVAEKEDILTSNVFSFLKYTSRNVFLREFLSTVGCEVAPEEAECAEFIFWQRYEENTEPDLVIIAGKYYVLIEAKYLSDFDLGGKGRKHQLLREIEGGTLDAHNYGKEFKLVAITADYYCKDDKFKIIPKSTNFKWINWQSLYCLFTDLLESVKTISPQERMFAKDLCDLLDKKNLRPFRGLGRCHTRQQVQQTRQTIFFNVATGQFREQFIGFVKSLTIAGGIGLVPNRIFWQSTRQLFVGLSGGDCLKTIPKTIFMERHDNG